MNIESQGEINDLRVDGLNCPVVEMVLEDTLQCFSESVFGLSSEILPVN